MSSKKSRSAAALLLGLMVLAAAFAGCAKSDEPLVTPVPEGHTVEESPVGLIGFESPEPNGVTFEIIPEADENIYEMTVSYRLGDEAWGSENMKTQDGSFFGMKDVVMKVFRIEDLGNDSIPPMTLSFAFTDAYGNVTEAENEYTVDMPQAEGRYLVKITGSKETGYILSNQ